MNGFQPAGTVGDDSAVLGGEEARRARPDQLVSGRLFVGQLASGASPFWNREVSIVVKVTKFTSTLIYKCDNDTVSHSCCKT
jgi:hypothetical protein